jgi:hypothetical protein
MMDFGSFFGNPALESGIFGGTLGFLLFPLMLWGIFWKGWSLWKAAHAESKIWFVVLLLVNTIGILDILYIFVFSKMKKSSKKSR